MAVKSVVISAGHGKYVPGACGVIDEHTEAVRVMDAVAKLLELRGVVVKTFEDTTSHDQSTNLHTIVDFHNSQQRDLDVSIHFNAYEQSDAPKGTEVLYTTQEELAAAMSAAIAECGFINRGAKRETDLYFLNNTDMPAILIEVCFVDSTADVDIYTNNFDEICAAIAGTPVDMPEVVIPRPYLFTARGPCSYFGGPDDEGVDEDEGLAFIYHIDEAPYLFLPEEGTEEGMGLARQLNPFVHYVACRWDYELTPKEMLLRHFALVRSVETGRTLTAFPADWGPHKDTGRVADLSPSLLEDLQLTTDDEVEVIFPFGEIK